MPTLRHPQSDHALEVDAAQVALYVSQGWAEDAAPDVAEDDDYN